MKKLLTLALVLASTSLFAQTLPGPDNGAGSSFPNPIAVGGNLITFPSGPATMARTDAAQTFVGNQSVTGWIAPSYGLVSPSTTFSSLPSPLSVAIEAQYFVSDVGTAGSYWYSDGTVWHPINGVVTLATFTIPVFIAPTGNIAATTGINTLGTSLVGTFPSAYLCYPAGAWTGSAAGCYYAVCSSATSCTQYSNQYTSGTPSVPASPALVTTGAGAYTGVNGSYVQIMAFPIQANLMGLNGSIALETECFANTSANGKYASAYLGAGGSFLYGGSSHANFSASGAVNIHYLAQNQNSASLQINHQEFIYTSASPVLEVDSNTVNTTSSQNFLMFVQSSTIGSDWIGCGTTTLTLRR